MHGYVVPMLKRRRRQRYAPIEGGRFIGAFMTQLRLPGFPRALLSMFRNGALGPQFDAYRALAAHDLPALVLRGSEDPILSRAQVAALSASLPRALCHEIPDTAHGFLLTDPERSAAIILDYLAHCEPAAVSSDGHPTLIKS